MPQPLQKSKFVSARFLSFMGMQFSGQFMEQIKHWVHFFWSQTGEKVFHPPVLYSDELPGFIILPPNGICDDDFNIF